MLELLIFGLATWRISYFFIEDDGPFRLAARLRHIVGADKHGEITGPAFVFTCIYCMSVWVAVGLWAIFQHDWNADVIPRVATYSALAIGYHWLMVLIRAEN